MNPRLRPKKAPNPEFSPISASGFFETALQVAVPDRGIESRVYYTPPKTSDGTVIICHHGAGYSGLSFACFAKEVTDMTRGECGILALDARRHGMFSKHKTKSVSLTERKGRRPRLILQTRTYLSMFLLRTFVHYYR